MRNPIPTTGEPKNSATMAPISASVVEIFNPLNIKGIAAGSRNFKNDCAGRAAYVCIKSRCMAVVSRNPATVFTSIGASATTISDDRRSRQDDLAAY